ncbi:single-stranded DNA-binding protein [Desulfurobacterium crinifex]
MNKVILLGRLVADAEIKPLKDINLITFRVAYNERWKSGNEWKEEAYFFDVDFFTKYEDYIEKLTKGALVLLEGKLRQERWESDGKKHSRVKIRAEKVRILSVKADEVPDPEDIEF